jgi:hypothetical protein
MWRRGLVISAVFALVTGLFRITPNPLAGIAIGLLTFAFFVSVTFVLDWVFARERLPWFVYRALTAPA